MTEKERIREIIKDAYDPDYEASLLDSDVDALLGLYHQLLSEDRLENNSWLLRFLVENQDKTVTEIIDLLGKPATLNKEKD